MKKTIKMTTEQAKELYAQNKSYRDNILSEFTNEELGIKPPKPPKPILRDWEDIINEQNKNGIYRCCVTNDGCIQNSGYDLNYSVWDVPNIKHAKSMLAFAKLSILMADLGDECNVDWNNGIQDKSIIYSVSNRLAIDKKKITNTFLAFNTKEIRDAFLKKHERLIKDYFMID